MTKATLANGVEQAVIAVDDGAVANEKPKSWWEQQPCFSRALPVAAVLLVVFLVATTVAVTMKRSETSASPQGATDPYFQPSLEPSSTPSPLISPDVQPSASKPTAEEEDTEIASDPTDFPSSLPSLFPSTTPTAAPTVTPPPFAFYVMGDVPYTESEAKILSEQFENMTTSRHPGAQFVVHVGDFQSGLLSNCTETVYTDFRKIVLKSPLPMLVLAGDNDYLDCPHIEEAWSYFLQTFSNIEKRWSDQLPPGVNELAVNRWWGQRPEMFSFVNDGILFLSVNLMNAPEEQVNTEEWNSRMADNAAWVLSEADAAFAQHDIRGVVMFSHAQPSSLLLSYYQTILAQVFQERLELPVLNFHGDGHVFKINRRFSNDTGWTGFTDIQVDQGGKADPLLVEVAPIVDGVMEPFSSDDSGLQHVFGDGLFRIDRQKGRYPRTS